MEPVQPVQPDRETRELTADEAAFARELAARRPTDDLPARVAQWFDAREVDGWPGQREP